MSAFRKAVYAGSFDPVTNGHLYMMKTGVRLFDELVIAVGENPGKRCAFSMDERIEMLRSVTRGMAGVTVMPMPRVYLVDFAASLHAEYLLRGLRGEEDFRFERVMRHLNADMRPELTSVYLMPPRELAEVSSSFIMGMVGPEGWERAVARYVPEEVMRVLRAKQAKSGGAPW